MLLKYCRSIPIIDLYINPILAGEQLKGECTRLTYKLEALWESTFF